MMPSAKSSILIPFVGGREVFAFADFVVVIICYLFLSREPWKLSIILNTKDCVKTGWHLNRIKKNSKVLRIADWEKNGIFVFIITHDLLVITPITTLLHMHQFT